MAANCHSPNHRTEELEVYQHKEEKAQRRALLKDEHGRALLRDEHGAPGFPAGNGREAGTEGSW